MSTLGVIVGRFQVDDLHMGHRSIFEYLKHNVDEVLVVLGEGPLPTTANNPLAVKSRQYMIDSYLAELDISGISVSLKDHPDDKIWSQNLDDLIDRWNDHDEAVIYHSRDTSTEAYTGTHERAVLPAVAGLSSTMRRETLGKSASNPSVDFRRGVIWANQNRFPTVYSCVDAAVVWNKYHGSFYPESCHILLITKDIVPGQYMFPGGFAELNSTDEEDAKREVFEETGVDIFAEEGEWLGSFTQDDWRYRSEVDEIRTRLFKFEIDSLDNPPTPTAADDAATAQWVPFADLTVDDFNKCHRALFERLLEEL